MKNEQSNQEQQNWLRCAIYTRCATMTLVASSSSSDALARQQEVCLKVAADRHMIVWNQMTQIKEPETGQVITRRKKKSEHIVVEAPHLRIVTDEQWNRAAERRSVSKTPLDNSHSSVALGISP